MNRKRTAFSKLAASSLLVATSMVGCTGQALHRQAGVSAGKLGTMADAQARNAEAALKQHDAAKAIQLAEAAVAASPDKAEFRTLLGRAYLMDGRFASARQAFEDALTLGSTDGRTIVNLSLIHVAEGDSKGAQRLLTDRVDVLTAADYGLAMAMAGNPDEAIRVLSQAIHAPTAGAKERQNLAYAYALAGQWTEARQVAALDLAPIDAARRVLQWAESAQPGGESRRVIAMMGVAPRADDAGLPVRLALGQPQAQAPVQMAEAAAPAAVSASQDFVPLPVEEAAAPAPQPVAAPAKVAAAAPAPAPAPAPTPAKWAVAEDDAVTVPRLHPRAARLGCARAQGSLRARSASNTRAAAQIQHSNSHPRQPVEAGRRRSRFRLGRPARRLLHLAVRPRRLETLR
jgi:Flp pilus assembly protein TadD